MNATDLYERAEQFYQKRLRADLDRAHLNSFVAITPESGDFYPTFIGPDFDARSIA
jgi:hypothetical protein